MSDRERSCFTEKLSFYIDLDDEDRALLARFERDERNYRRGEMVSRSGHPMSEIYVVKRGWLLTATAMPDGRRQILRLHFPGDMVGLTETPLSASPHEVQAATDVTLCPFPKSQMDRIFNESPKLTALFFSFAMVDQLLLLDRIRVLGRMSARERLAHFLLEIRARLRITNPRMGQNFRLPLTQGQIADAVGLTNVYVSKSMSRLRDEGLISIDEGTVTLEDEAALSHLCDFQDRHRSLDVTWLPEEVEEEEDA